MATHKKSTNRLPLFFIAGGMAGFINVTLPASATVFLDSNGFNFSKGMYGGLFIFCLSAAVLSSWTFRHLTQRFHIGLVLKLGLAAYAIGSLLFASGLLAVDQRLAAYALTSISVTLMGLGFGATLSALNELVVTQSGNRPEVNLTYLHAAVTGGAALAPSAVGWCIEIGLWAAAPIGAGALMLLLLFYVQKVISGDRRVESAQSVSIESRTHPHSRMEIYFLALAALYGLCEAAVANWSTVILQLQYAVAESQATAVMSLFWGGVAVFRFLFARFAPERHIKLFWFLSPILTFVSLALIGSSPAAAWIVFAVALAGCAMSYYFPLTLAIAGSVLPESRKRLSGTTVATLLSGAGLSAFSIGLLADVGFARISTILGAFGIFAILMIVIQIGVYKAR